MIAQVPQQPDAPATVYARAFSRAAAPGGRLRKLSVTSARHRARQAFPNAVWGALAADEAIAFINFDPLLCDEERCPIGTATRSYYQDQSHLSGDGAARLVPAITQLLGCA